MEAAKMVKAATVDMKLEVILLAVTDVDRSKAFYENLGWRIDADFAAGEEFRVIQVTPPNSSASIIFGKGLPSGKPGSENFVLAAKDINAARDELVGRGVDVSEVFHYAAGPFNNLGEEPRISGPDPERRSYYSFVSFDDPDGNRWHVQEISTRLPGREWSHETDVATLAELLHETEQHHGKFEASHAAHNWWDWYAPYLNARQTGSTPDDAATTADQRMEEVFKTPTR